MLSLKYALCAEAVVRDAASNALSAFNILEEINAVGFPVVVPRLAIVVALQREASDDSDQPASLRITLGDLELFSHAFTLTFREKLLNRAILALQGVVIPAPGALKIEFSTSGLVHTITLPVATLGQQQLPLTFSDASLQEATSA